MSPGAARDQLAIGLDMIRTAEGALYQQGGVSEEQAVAAASTIEQARKFIEPARDLLDLLNSMEVERMRRRPT